MSEVPRAFSLKDLGNLIKPSEGKSEAEIVGRLLLESRARRIGIQARQALDEARHRATAWLSHDGGSLAAIFLSEILREYAYEEFASSERRREYWNKAIRNLAEHVQNSVHATAEYARLVCDSVQDRLSSIEPVENANRLRQARGQIEAILKSVRDPQERGPLLAAKSAVLGHLAAMNVRGSAQHLALLQESYRCANLAAEQHAEAVETLELAESTWRIARFEKTDLAYSARLRKAEELFLVASSMNHEPAVYALAAFYRNSYRPLEATESYPKDSTCLRNVRRQLRDSFILAEAAIQLWYQGYPPEKTEPALGTSAVFLEAALASGFLHARIIVDLAYIRAILGGPADGETVLERLSKDPSQLWNDAIFLASQDPSNDLLLTAFVLGIGSSSVWSSLGSYALEFRNDAKLAGALYHGAVKINPYNAVALTNLARFLAPTDKPEALRLLARASNFADARFRWWRVVQAEIQGARSPPPEIIRSTAPRKRSNVVRRSSSWASVRRTFREIEGMLPQTRGQRLNALLTDIVALTGLSGSGPYRLKEPGGSSPELDGYFELDHDRYRVECKWEKGKVTPNDLVVFREKISVAGVSGLFVGMNGYLDGAREKAKDLSKTVPLVLVDGEELRGVVDGLVGFDDMVRLKRSWLDQRSESFHRFLPEARAARLA